MCPHWLLCGLQTSDDAERSLLVKLKTECGYQFTSKLESMFTDIKTSRDTMLEYKAQETASTSSSSDLDLSVQVPPHRLTPFSSHTVACFYPLGSYLLSKTVHRPICSKLQKWTSLPKQVVCQRLSYPFEGSESYWPVRTGPHRHQLHISLCAHQTQSLLYIFAVCMAQLRV